MNKQGVLEQDITLNNGINMPLFGLGLYKVSHGKAGVEVIKFALNHGYRLLDGAVYYQNTAIVREAIDQSNVEREDVFFTSKIWNFKRSCDAKDTVHQIEETLRTLHTTYIDLFLIHWPCDNTLEVFRVLKRYYDQGSIKAIGVSNFTSEQLEAFIADTQFIPAVNQIQLAPGLNRTDVVATCRKYKIAVNGWRPLGVNILDNSVITAIARHHNVSGAQVCVKWAVMQNYITIPKTNHPHRVLENCAIDNFTLTATEIDLINNMPQQEIYWPFDWFRADKINWQQ